MSPSARRPAQRGGADRQATQLCCVAGAADDDRVGQTLDLRFGTWNVQALGWNVLQMLLGYKAEEQGSSGGEGRNRGGGANSRGRWVPEALNLDVLGLTETWWDERQIKWQ